MMIQESVLPSDISKINQGCFLWSITPLRKISDKSFYKVNANIPAEILLLI